LSDKDIERFVSAYQAYQGKVVKSTEKETPEVVAETTPVETPVETAPVETPAETPAEIEKNDTPATEELPTETKEGAETPEEDKPTTEDAPVAEEVTTTKSEEDGGQGEDTPEEEAPVASETEVSEAVETAVEKMFTDKVQPVLDAMQKSIEEGFTKVNESLASMNTVEKSFDISPMQKSMESVTQNVATLAELVSKTVDTVNALGQRTLGRKSLATFTPVEKNFDGNATTPTTEAPKTPEEQVDVLMAKGMPFAQAYAEVKKSV
jgi:hypothetical protein